LNDKKTNFLNGAGKYLVVEACEYRDAFFDINPQMIVLTNIEADHLDWFKDIGGVKRAFREFVSKLGNEQKLICSARDKIVKDVIKELPAKIVDYTLADLDNFVLPCIGDFNYENAQAAYTVALELGVGQGVAGEALESYKGTQRRFERMGVMTGDIEVYSDYAHHPSAIKKTLDAASKLFSDKKLFVVFQPHLYSRTKDFYKDFIASLSGIPAVLLVDIYGAREKDPGDINLREMAQDIAGSFNTAEYVGSIENAIKRVRETVTENNVVIIMGAGDVHKVAEELVRTCSRSRFPDEFSKF
jgi:UDP-N-acetylmuramate--alanine ligase